MYPRDTNSQKLDKSQQQRKDRKQLTEEGEKGKSVFIIASSLSFLRNGKRKKVLCNLVVKHKEVKKGS
jgi:hypothetical protein